MVCSGQGGTGTDLCEGSRFPACYRVVIARCVYFFVQNSYYSSDRVACMLVQGWTAMLLRQWALHKHSQDIFSLFKKFEQWLKLQMFWKKYRGADKSLAWSRRKETQKHVRDPRDFNNIEMWAVIIFFCPQPHPTPQRKVPKEIHAILTETLACFLPGWAKDLSAPSYDAAWPFWGEPSSSHSVPSGATCSVRGLCYQVTWSLQCSGYWHGQQSTCRVQGVTSQVTIIHWVFGTHCVRDTFLFKSNKTPTWCNTVQVLFLQSHSTCFGRQAPIIRSI